MRRSITLVLVLVAMFSFLLSPSVSAEETLDILLLGTDELGDAITGQEEDSRADAIFLLSIRPGQAGFRVLSIERDYLVELPDIGPNKLGTSTYFGGPELAVSMVNQLFDLNVEYYVQIDIQNVIRAVDEMGGLDVEVYQDEVESVNTFIDGILAFQNLTRVKAGMNHLAGPEAWAFMGVRNSEMDSVKSNAQRNGRQQRIISAGMDKLSAMKLDEVISLADTILPLVKTNLSTSNVISIIKMVYGNDMDNMKFLYTPTTDYQIRTIRMHRVVQVTDMEQEVKDIQKFLSE